MEEFLVVEFFKNAHGTERELKWVFGTAQLLEILNDAKKNDKKICVYPIGDCLIDWS